MFFEETYRVDTRDADPQGLCRPSSLLGYLQEAATKAAIEAHISREVMLTRYNAFWMMARIWYRLEKPLRWDEPVTVQTWHRGGKGASMYRDFDLFQNGTPVGEAVSVWVLADQDTRGLFRLSTAVEFETTTGGELCKEKRLPKLRVPGPLTHAEDRALHYSDCDVNGHVNNARYADLTCDALRLETRGKGQFVSELQLGYLAECMPGETICLSAGQYEDRWYVEGADQGGETRFDAALRMTPLDNPRHWG